MRRSWYLSSTLAAKYVPDLSDYRMDVPNLDRSTRRGKQVFKVSPVATQLLLAKAAAGTSVCTLQVAYLAGDH
eukprot:258804-Amorphochlora_amoeboformis.AAC.1